MSPRATSCPVLLPADITREFISRTRYRIVADPSKADAVLTGAVINFVAYPTIFDPASGRATGVQVVVNVQLTLTDRATGKVLFTRPRCRIPRALRNHHRSAVLLRRERHGPGPPEPGRGPQRRHRDPGGFLTPAQLFSRIKRNDLPPGDPAARSRGLRTPPAQGGAVRHRSRRRRRAARSHRSDAGRNPGRRPRAFAVRLRAPDLGGQRGSRASPRPCRGR